LLLLEKFKNFVIQLVLLSVVVFEGSAQVRSVVNKNCKTVSFHGDVTGGYGTLYNNKFGNSGSYLFGKVNSVINYKGVPFTTSCGYTSASNGISKFGPFSVKFSRINLDKFIQDELSQTDLRQGANAKQKFQELAQKLADYEYLERVSNANIKYREICKDTSTYNSDAHSMVKDSLRIIIDEYEEMQWEFRKLRSSKLGVVDSIASKEIRNSNISNSADSITSVDSMVLYANKRSNLEKFVSNTDTIKYSKFQHIWSKFEKISIGYDVLDQSIITMSSYSYAGFTIDYKLKYLTIGGSIGKHSGYSNSSGNALLVTPFTDWKSKENFLQTRVIFGENENSMSLAYTRFRNVEALPWYNRLTANSSVDLVSIHSVKKLNRFSTLEFDLSKQVNQSTSSLEKSTFSDRSALNVTSENNLEEIGARIIIGYRNIGSSYFTPGNRYLANSMQNMSLCIEKTLFRDKLTSKLNFSRTWNSTSSKITDGIQFGYKLNSKHNLSYSISRNTIKLISSEVVQTFLNNQVGLNSVISKKMLFSIFTNYGIVQRNNLTTSKDYLLSTSVTIRLDKFTLIPRVSYFLKNTSTQLVQGLSSLISLNSIISNQLSLNLSIGFNNTGSLNSLNLSSGVDYKIRRHISVKLSGMYQNYYRKSMLSSYDYSCQGQGSIIIKF